MSNEINSVVVGLKMDVQSRDLLTWALVKVVQPGDSVVAFHVLLESNSNSSSMDSVADTINSTLAVYAGFCNLKKVFLLFPLFLVFYRNFMIWVS